MVKNIDFIRILIYQEYLSRTALTNPVYRISFVDTFPERVECSEVQG